MRSNFRIMVLLTIIFCTTCTSQSLNYIEENVIFPSNDVTLAGTLSIPKYYSEFPILIMITGGGNRNRDAKIGKFLPYKLIADYLTPKGIAILRWDDRGIEGSTGEKSLNSTLDDFKEDALAAIKYLNSRDDLSITDIGLFGHCAGATVALMVANESDEISFIISMAGPGMSGEYTIFYETRATLEDDGRTESDIIELQKLRKELFQVMRADSGWTDIDKKTRDFIFKHYNSLDETIISKYDDFEHFYRRSYDAAYIRYGKYKYIQDFIIIDPIPYYENYNKPILILFGANDTNVPYKYHQQPLIDSFKIANNTNYQFSIIPDADHYFVKDWKTREFVPDFLPTIEDWLRKTDFIK